MTWKLPASIVRMKSIIDNIDNFVRRSRNANQDQICAWAAANGYHVSFVSDECWVVHAYCPELPGTFTFSVEREIAPPAQPNERGS